MSEQHRFETIYVELDTLLDTRIATVARIDQGKAAEILKGDYLTRQCDKFEGVDQDLYRKQYLERDNVTLAAAHPTSMLAMLSGITATLVEQARTMPFHYGAKVVVNVYPYKLSEQEISEIGKAVAVWSDPNAQVEIVNMSVSELTPAYCKQNFSMMVMYEYNPWLDAHVEAFKKCRLPEVLLMAPAIYFNQIPTEEELKRELEESAHPFKAMEMLASPIVELRLLDISTFSLLPTPETA